MIPIIMSVHFALCNSQWPLQSVGSDFWGLPPVSSDQLSYPYDDMIEWAQVSQNPDLKLPDAQNTMLQASELPEEASKISENATSDHVWVMDRVRSMANEKKVLRNDTDEFMHRFQNAYNNLGLDEVDNQISADNAYKYGMSVILRFLLEFYRIFRKLSSSQSTPSHLPAIDVYGASYDEAVQVMKAKKNYSILEISAPVRRSADIFKSILYESVEIVQTKCIMNAPNWQCIILYIANLISESINCPNVWYHAFVHMLTLENRLSVQDSFIYKIADIVKFTNIPFENIFDFVMEKFTEYREFGRVQLSTEAILFTMLADLQENGLLDCMSINYLYN